MNDKNNTMSSMSKNIQTLTDAMKNRDGKFSNTEVDTALMSQLNLIYTNPEVYLYLIMLTKKDY